MGHLLRLTVQEANPVETLQNQFNGYGSTPQIVARTPDKLRLKKSLEVWSPEIISSVVNAFTEEKFPTIYALNKIDHPDADKTFLRLQRCKIRNPTYYALQYRRYSCENWRSRASSDMWNVCQVDLEVHVSANGIIQEKTEEDEVANSLNSYTI